MIKWAEAELKRLEDMCEDDNEKKMQRHMTGNIIDVLKVLSKQGHTGMSMSYLMHILTCIVDHKPLTPLTGEDDEWEETEWGGYVNKRCQSVIKDKEGDAWYLEGYAYCEPESNAWFNCHESRKKVTFPCGYEQLMTEYRQLKHPMTEVSVEEQINNGDFTIIKKG